MMPVTEMVNGPGWYVQLWWTLATFMLVGSAIIAGLFAWFAGPHIIAKGIELWILKGPK